MRGRLALALLAMLVLGAPQVAGLIVPLENYQIRVALRGYDDGVTRLPLAGAREPTLVDAPILPSLTGTCVVAGCELVVPRLQYHWFDLRLLDLDGEPVRHATVTATFLGFEGGVDQVRFKTDAQGAASLLRRGAAADVVQVQLLLPDDASATYAWTVGEATPGATAPLVIRGDGRLLEATIDVLRPEHVWIDHHAVVQNGTTSPASALVADLAVHRDGARVFAAAAYGAFSDAHDVELAVTSAGAEEALDLGLPLDLLVDATSSTVDIHGTLNASYRIVATVGSTGDGADAFLRAFAPPGTLRVSLREIGPLEAAGPSFEGVRLTALDHGAVLGRFDATLDAATPGLVMMDAHLPLASSASATFARGAASRSEALTEEARHFLDDGSCAGEWRVSLTDYVGLGEPSVALAHASGYSIPDWARDAFPELGLCDA